VTTRPRLLLMDGHSLAYRAFHALPVENFATTTGQPTNAVYGFTSMLINLLRDEQPTHLAVAFDVSRQTFRSEQFPQYKANRSASPAEFSGQVALIHEVLDAMDIVSVELPGYEADDIIATLARRAEQAGFEVLIISGDRDAVQLVDETTTLLYPRKGVSDLARLTPAAVLAKYKVGPQQYPDLAALVGETSDNLPGIPGVGPGFAAKWLAQFGSLEELLTRADEVTGKKGEALREHIDQVRTNRALNALVRDLTLPVELADLQRHDFDRGKVHEVFDALEFRVLRERLFDYLSDQVGPAGERAEVEVADIAPGAFGQWLAAQAPAGGPRVALAVQGAWGQGTGRTDAVALATADGSVAYLDLQSCPDADADALRDWLADQRVAKAMHDAKGPLLALRARGWQVAGLSSDTALAAYLAMPGQRSFDLADLVARFLQRELGAGADSGDQLALGLTEDAATPLGEQARAILDLADALDARLAAAGTLPLLSELELPLQSVLVSMEAAGIAVDRAGLAELERTFADRMAAAESEAHTLAGHPFNLGSPKQLQGVLFEERGLPKTKRIKTGYTTDADALASLFAATEDPLLETLLRWRDVSKLRQTVAGLLPLVDAGGRIHTTFQQTVAATGRLSSADPNLQNIPIRTAEGRRIRGCFVAGPDYDVLMTADYSQIEMRIMAHLSADEGLIDAFRSGEDLHTTVASRVFSCAPEEVDAEKRRRIKAMSYGLAYGLSAYGLSQQLGIEVDEARGLMDEYFARFGGVRDYLHEVVEQARATGYTATMMGRRRYLPDLSSDLRQRREMAERMALNAPIQGSAADIMKVAMIRASDALGSAGLSSRLLLQVHDELVVEVAPGEAEQVAALIRDAMGSAAVLSVPLEVSIGVGRTWEDAGH
jgi:DNA polymerase-1